MPKKSYWYLIIGLAITLSALLFSISYQVSAATPTPRACHECETLAPREAIANAVFFWMDGCPNCEIVINKVLPEAQATYGDKFVVQSVELKGVDDVDALYQYGKRIGLDANQIAVPMLLIGEKVLTGSEVIQSNLTTEIDRCLALGNCTLPLVPELAITQQPQLIETPTPAETPDPATVPSATTTIYFFWGDGCPHCAAAEPVLASFVEKYPNVEFLNYEVWYNEPNQALFVAMATEFGFEPSGVPAIFVGNKYWIGYSEYVGQEIEAYIKTCVENGCPDRGVGVIPGRMLNPRADGQVSTEDGNSAKIKVPLLGEIELAKQSMWLSTALIAFVDGVNPCSIWVLTMLLAITLHASSRKKVIVIGLIFLTVTAAIYGLFITGLFTMFKIVNFVGWIQVVVALVALFFAIINIKDYFWYKEGISFTISDEKKPGIFARMRRLMDASQSFWGLAGATIVLAAGVSLVEFSCTAGFPVLWTNLLVSQQVTGMAFVLLLLLYLLIYQADELVIFFVAVSSLKASKLEEKHGRILKLIGGMLMLVLAGVMLINPKLMNSVSSSLIIFGIAFGATLLVLLLHRVILPKLGIYIGSEQTGKKRKKGRSRA